MLREDYATWQCGRHSISLARPRIMGILNVTPDSFSDGGQHDERAEAVAHGLAMLDAGADIIDVGGESTRPGFEAVSSEEEARRVVPVVRDLVEAGAIVSVDTRHADVARMCVRLGASIINDVTGFTDPEMVKVAADTNCGCLIMHAGEVSERRPRREVTLDSTPKPRTASSAVVVPMPSKTTKDAKASTPAKDEQPVKVDAPAQLELPVEPEAPAAPVDPSADRLGQVMARSARGLSNPTVRLVSGSRRFTLPEEAPIMRRIMGFLGDQARVLMRAGVDHDRICVDPGPGFGKHTDEDVVIQRATAKMVSMGYPVACAVSRKRVIGAITGTPEVSQRDAGTFGMVIAAVESGARILRVHDVAGTAAALDAYWAVAHPDPRRAFVSLGSNVGDRVGYLGRATAMIDAIPLTCVVGVSHAYETDPAYGIATPVANCVVELKTELAPIVLLQHLLSIETALGRERKAGEKGHGPRTIDCDLVWVEDEMHSGAMLTLPHPGLCERDYVLIPMEDLMHDPVRFLTHAGVTVVPEEERVGRVRTDLGEVVWE